MSRAFTVCERETRIAIKDGGRTVAYVQMAADDEEIAKLFAAAPQLLEAAKAARVRLDGIGRHAARGADVMTSDVVALLDSAIAAAEVA